MFLTAFNNSAGLGLGSIIGGNLLEKVTVHHLFIGAGVLAMSVLILYVLLFELVLKLLKPVKSSSSQGGRFYFRLSSHTVVQGHRGVTSYCMVVATTDDEAAAESISAEAREMKDFIGSGQTDADQEDGLDSADPFLQK